MLPREIENMLKKPGIYKSRIQKLITSLGDIKPFKNDDIPGDLERILWDKAGLDMEVEFDDTGNDLGIFFYDPRRRGGKIILDSNLPGPSAILQVGGHEAMHMLYSDRYGISGKSKFTQGQFMQNPEESIIEQGVSRLLNPTEVSTEVSQEFLRRFSISETVPRLPYYYSSLQMLSQQHVIFSNGIDNMNSASHVYVEIRVEQDNSTFCRRVILCNSDVDESYYPKEWQEYGISLSTAQMKNAAELLMYVSHFLALQDCHTRNEKIQLLTSGNVNCDVFMTEEPCPFTDEHETDMRPMKYAIHVDPDKNDHRISKFMVHVGNCNTLSELGFTIGNTKIILPTSMAKPFSSCQIEDPFW